MTELGRFEGVVVRAGDPGFDEVREIFNADVADVPAMVVRPVDADEVAAAVRGARAAGLPLAVRAGGHSFAGHATVDDGAVLDLRLMDAASVDPATGVVTVQPGLTWGQLDARTQEHGLAVPGGSISSVGVTGFTLGTGLGWLGRRHGLAADNLHSVELVTAEGERVRADAEHHPDLFWALRGGCGNFGVVTEMTFQAHPVTDLVAGTMMVPLERAAEVLEALSGITPELPDDVSWTAVIVRLPAAEVVPAMVRDQHVLLVNVCAVGVPDELEPHLERLREVVDPVLDEVRATPYTELQRAGDPSAPAGACWDVRSEWLTTIDEQAASDLVAAAGRAESPLYELVVRPLGGAIARPGNGATPFSFRDAGFLLEVIAGWLPDDSRRDQHRSWMTATWEALSRVSAGGPDVNHLGQGEGEDRVRASYTPQVYARLVDVKRRYDPDDVFSSTQHIPPHPAPPGGATSGRAER